ncbi:hypothetical protein G7046_g1611 [Stylonectria norvegica]|nr:hypothetical protein G7046_g1611 [Stylonectria norvegica]
MSSSIAIPGPSATATPFHQSPKGGRSSSNSPYSSSPSSSPPSSRKEKMLHSRRPSLLSAFPSSPSFSSSPRPLASSSVEPSLVLWPRLCSAMIMSRAVRMRSLYQTVANPPLGSAISKQESTVINIGDPDGPPRLISYLSSSQGFAWNPEIFLPSYVDCDYVPLENRREPVHEILLSDEESKNLLPQ